MTSRLRNRPPTDVMTQVIRPDCEVVGKAELHSYLGPGKIAGMAPCPMMYGPYGLWWSQGTAWDSAAETSKKSRTVFAANDPLLQQWSKTKQRQHHLISSAGLALTPPMVGFLAACNEDSASARLGPFEASNKGASTAIFAPRHVMASVDGAKTVATLRFSPGGPSGNGNFLACSDPSALPATVARQTPNTVLLGMTAGDTAAAISKYVSRIVLDCAISWALGKIGGRIGSAATGFFLRQLERYLPGLVAGVLRPLAGPIADQVGNLVGSGLNAGVSLLRGDLTADESDDAFADDWDEYVVSP